jgi:hypothetical protein
MAAGPTQPPDQATRAVGEVLGMEDSDHDYELRLTRFVSEGTSTFGREVQAAFNTTSDDTDDAYALFYALHIYHRRRKEHSELAALIRDSGDRFRNRPTFPHLQSLCYVTERREDEAFQCATEAREKAPRHAGVLNHYASVALSRAEKTEPPDADLLKQAKEALDTALAATGGVYARHHATYARLHTLREEYAAAEQELDRAVDLEDPGPDWPVRIGEYEALRLSNRAAQLRGEQRRTAQKLDEMRESLENRVGAVRSEAFQLLGLLGAVIAFVVSTSTIAAQLRSFETSGRLIVLLGGVILVIYAGFGAAFGQPTRRHLGVHLFVLALGFAVGAYAVFWWDPK